MRKSWGILGLVVVLAGCGHVTSAGAAPSGRAVVVTRGASVAPVPPYAEPHDGAPHEAENRGAIQPKGLSAADVRELTLEANAVLAGLQRQRAASDWRPETTIAVFTAAGHPRSTVSARPMTGGPGVVFGVSTAHGCLVGDVRPSRVLVEPRGAIADWGCETPDTH